MSFFGDIRFFVLLFAALIPAVILGLREKSLKFYSLFLSFVFIYFVFRNDHRQFLYLIAFYIVEVYVIKIYIFLRKKFGRNSVIYGHFLFIAALPLLISKFSGLFDKNIFGFIGISYITFKVLQIIIETYDDVIKDIKVFDLTSFLLFFPVLSSGPIDRSRRYINDLNTVYTKKEYVNLLGIGLQKILIGLTYKFAFSMIFCNLMNRYVGHYTFLSIIAYTYCYGFYMFFDFAGYSLMAIGTSYILGIKTPDNFKYPFISVDIKDFWNRWHITLSHWFRDFIFTRFMIKAIKNKWFKNRLDSAAAGFIVNMTIMGFWHGLTSYYILYGLYHGVLLAVTEIYQKKSKFYSRNKNKRLYKFASWFVTLNCVMFGFLIFSGKFNDIVHVIIKSIM